MNQLIGNNDEPSTEYQTVEWPELKQTRAWAALWKKGCRHYRARLHVAADIAGRYIMEASKAKDRVAKLEAVLRNLLMSIDLERPLSVQLEDAYIRAAKALEGTSILGACLWQYDERTDTWETGCGAMWVHTSSPPSDNEMLFCPFCSKRIDDGEEFEWSLGEPTE